MRKRAVYFILLFNAFIFVMMTFSGVFSTRDPVLQMLLLLRYGAQYGPRVDAGDWFRLITALFVHGGILHILFNSYALYYFGLIVEDIYGTEKFLVGYFFTGIVGNLATHVFYHDTISVGASGAIFGLIGILFAAGFSKGHTLLHETCDRHVASSHHSDQRCVRISPGHEHQQRGSSWRFPVWNASWIHDETLLVEKEDPLEGPRDSRRFARRSLLRFPD